MKEIIFKLLMVVGILLMFIGIMRVYLWSIIIGGILEFVAGYFYIEEKRRARK